MKVSNPLTIIAIFSGLAETLATVALVQLPAEIQELFVYFVMAFPAGIVLLFFFVLFFKNSVLYAPSDYDNQIHYLEANNLREKVGVEVDTVFEEINQQGTRLTKEEVDKAKRSISKTIARETVVGRHREILEFLRDNPSGLKEIAENFGLSMFTAKHYLEQLEHSGLVKSKDVMVSIGGSKRTESIWQYNA